MKAGTLRHRVEIQSADSTADELNQVIIEEGDWTTVDFRWADIKPLRSREMDHLNSIYSDVSHRIRIRQYDLTDEYRIKYGSRIFNIESVINVDERNKESELIVKEVV